MKIIYLHQYFNTPKIGGATRSYEMARRMVKKGHEVHMVSSDRSMIDSKTKGWDMEIVEGIVVHRINIPYDNKMSF